MRTLPFITGLILAVFSTTVMSYISLAVPIGPWIAPTLVLCALLMFKVVCREPNKHDVLAAVSVGSVGGILATACAFSFPTLYFLEPTLFDGLLAAPFYFWLTMFMVSVAAGGFGFYLANLLEHTCFVEQELAFPIGQLIFKMVTSIAQQARKAYELIAGCVSTVFFCLAQDVIKVIPRSFTLVSAQQLGFLALPQVRFDLQPLFWAIGFVTGHVIVIPLAVGALARIVLINPLNTFLFPELASIEFIFAFCSGMVVVGTLMSFVRLPKQIMKVWRVRGDTRFDFRAQKKSLGMLAVVLGVFCLFFDFSLLPFLFLLAGAAMCTYQMVLIAGKIGIAQLGAFATFVMVPAMLLFKLTTLQIVIVAVFVQICGGVAVDLLFARKAASLANMDLRRLRWYQGAGLLISCVVVGVVFWLLIKQFGLGSPELFAYKAQARRLLIDLKRFDVRVLLLGGVFGLALKQIKVTPSLVLGGILMPIHLSLGLIAGGLPALWIKKREELYPFWSGVYAANSLWMLVRAIL